eukprot:754455-Hanusia_phi.AAC.3
MELVVFTGPEAENCQTGSRVLPPDDLSWNWKTTNPSLFWGRSCWKGFPVPPHLGKDFMTNFVEAIPCCI